MLPKKDSPCAPALPRATMVSNITAFIESVRPHPYLYDKSQPEFKDAALKDERWALIADEYGLTAVQAQKKWRNLKDKYVRLKKKMYMDGLVVSQSGLSNGSVPKNKWAFYDILDGILCNIYDTVTITPAPSLQATVVETPYNAVNAEGMLDSMIKWQEHHLADMAVPPTPQPPLSATCATSSGIRKTEMITSKVSSKMAFSVTDKLEQRRKAMMMYWAQEEMRVMQEQSSLRNTALLQRLHDLEEKMKESSVKTERLKHLREEARKEAQNSKPPIPRKKKQVNFGPLTSTPNRAQPIRRGTEDTMQHPEERAALYMDIFPRRGIMRNSRNSSTTYRNHMRELPNFSAFKVDEKLMQNKSPPTQMYNEHHPHSLRFDPRIQRKVKVANFTKSAKMPPDFPANPKYTQNKPNSQPHEDFHETMEKMPSEELTSADEDHFDEDYTTRNISTEIPIEAKMEVETAKIVSNDEILFKHKLSDIMKVASNAKRGNRTTEEASVDMQAETHNDSDSKMKEKTQTIKNSNKIESSNTENKLPGNNKEAETVMFSTVPVEKEENPEIQRTEMSKEQTVSEIQKITTQLEVLSTTETMAEILVKSDIPKQSEAGILIKPEQLVESGIEGNADEKLDKEHLENQSISKNAVKADNLAKIQESEESAKKSEISTDQQSPKMSETVQTSENKTAIYIKEENATGDFLAFLSSDDDDDEDSFFDSIPKPHASAVQERMPEPQMKPKEAIKPEEMSDTLSDEVDSEIDQQLANLVTSTAPIRFVEHEMAQSEQDLQKEENPPSEIPQKDRTCKDANSERSTESGFTSQSNQKLHQKLAIHLGLNKTTLKTTEPDLKKVEDQVEEDDFDFYD